MKAVTANLKIFYQRPILYLWYFIILCQVPALVMSNDPERQDIAIFHLIMSMIFGLLVGSLQKEIMCRPVTYCLPNQRSLSHKLIFILGALLTLIPVAVQFKMMTATADNYLLTVAAVWLTGMSAYLLSVWLSFQQGYGENRPCLVGGLWAVFFIGIFYSRNHDLWPIFAETPLFIILPTLAWVVFFWFYLGKESYRRNFCGQNVSTMFDKWDMHKIRAQRTARAVEKIKYRSKISAIVEQFITGKMKTCSEWKNRTAFGFIYTSFDRMLVTSLIEMLPLGLILLVFGYVFGSIAKDTPNEASVMLDILYIMPVMGAMLHMFPSHPTLHIPADRKEKFYASFVNGIFVVIFVMVFAGAVVSLANILQPYMPKIPGHIFNPSANELSFAAPKLANIYIIPMLMPLGFIASILFGRRQRTLMFTAPTLFLACFFLHVSQITYQINWIVIPAGFAVSWLGFIAILRWHCFKRNLV
jgi:hypothetical protein